MKKLKREVRHLNLSKNAWRRLKQIKKRDKSSFDLDSALQELREHYMSKHQLEAQARAETVRQEDPKLYQKLLKAAQG